jgi:DNA processing protein
MLGDKDRRENFYHVALLLAKKAHAGSVNSNKELADRILKHGTIETVFRKTCADASPEELVEGCFRPNGNPDISKQLCSAFEKIEATPFQYKTLTLHSMEFPQRLLKENGNSPVIYTRGDISLASEKSMAVVGTRRLEENMDIVQGTELLERLIRSEYVIVSGLALGCDTLAHKYAVNNGGRTIAVLGTPLDKYYPDENRWLQEKIGEEHLLVSQYPIGSKSYPSYFAHRNITTVSLASGGIVVIRADDTSGTIHAVDFCVKQNKQVYVLENNLRQGYKWIKKNYSHIKPITKKKREGQ